MNNEYNNSRDFFNIIDIDKLQEEFLSKHITPSVTIINSNKKNTIAIPYLTSKSPIKNTEVKSKNISVTKKKKDTIILDINYINNKSIDTEQEKLKDSSKKSLFGNLKEEEYQHLMENIDQKTGIPKAIPIKYNNFHNFEESFSNSKTINEAKDTYVQNTEELNMVEIRQESKNKLDKLSKDEKLKLIKELEANIPKEFINKIKQKLATSNQIPNNNMTQEIKPINEVFGNINLSVLSFEELEKRVFSFKELISLLESSNNIHIRFSLNEILINLNSFVDLATIQENLYKLVNSCLNLLSSSDLSISSLSFIALTSIFDIITINNVKILNFQAFEQLEYPSKIDNQDQYKENESSTEIETVIISRLMDSSIQNKCKLALLIKSYSISFLKEYISVIESFVMNETIRSNSEIKIFANFLKMGLKLLYLNNEYRTNFLNTKHKIMTWFDYIVNSLVNVNDYDIISILKDKIMFLSVINRDFFISLDKYQHLHNMVINDKRYIILNLIYRNYHNKFKDNNHSISNYDLLCLNSTTIEEDHYLDYFVDFTTSSNKEISNITNILEIRIKYFKILNRINADTTIFQDKSILLLSENENNQINSILIQNLQSLNTSNLIETSIFLRFAEAYLSILKIAYLNPNLIKYKKFHLTQESSLVQSLIKFICNNIFNLLLGKSTETNQFITFLLKFIQYALYLNITLPGIIYIHFPSFIQNIDNQDYYYYKFLQLIKKHLIGNFIKTDKTWKGISDFDNFEDLNVYILSNDLIQIAEKYSQIKYNNIVITDDLVFSLQNTSKRLSFIHSTEVNFITNVLSINSDKISAHIKLSFMELSLLFNQITNQYNKIDSNYSISSLSINQLLLAIIKLNEYDIKYYDESLVIDVFRSIIQINNKTFNRDQTNKVKEIIDLFLSTFFAESFTGNSSIGLRSRLHYRLLLIFMFSVNYLDYALTNIFSTLIIQEYFNFVTICDIVGDVQLYTKDLKKHPHLKILIETLIGLRFKYRKDSMLLFNLLH